MHILLPFDLVPADSRVPQDAFDVTPASERAIRYAFETYGRHELAVTTIHLTTDTIDLEENLGAAEIRSIAEELGVSIEVSIHSVRDVDSLEALQAEILDFLATADVETVVVGYEPSSFDDVVFSGSTPARILDECSVPVVLVP